MTEEAEQEIAEEAPDKYADEASKFGWKPPEEFSGDGNHMSAEAFMTRGPGTSRKALAEVDALKRQNEEIRTGYDARLARMEAAQKANVDAQVEARAASIVAEQRAAAEEGDMEKFDALEAEKVKAAKEPANTIPESDRLAIEAWMPSNQWFNDDPVANADAIQYYNAFTENGMGTSEALEKVTERMKLKSPYLFPEEEPARKAAAVDSGGIPRRKSGGQKAWADIPGEDRRMVERQISDGDWDALAKEMRTSPKEAFAAKYWEQP